MRAAVRSVWFALLFASSASAVNIDWTYVGEPGNPTDPSGSGFGAVAYAYSISTHEITNAQYAEFLNAKAASDPLGLYNADMSGTFGGIERSGSPGSYTYDLAPGRGQMPVNRVSFYDALRFANWLNNGQGSGDTETGAYTLLGGAAIPSNGKTVTRNTGAAIFLTNEDEWYKAAYYNAASTSYFGFPTSSDVQTFCSGATSEPNYANCNFAGFADVTPVGSYTGSASPYGTFDQGGNVVEWTEGIVDDRGRSVRGGSFSDHPSSLVSGLRYGADESIEDQYHGFRVAMVVPEPGTGVLVITGLLGLAGWRRPRP